MRTVELLLNDELRVWQALDGRDRNPLHAPDRWVPHVSLARQGSPALAARVLPGLPPANGRFAGARSYDTATRTVTPLLSVC